VAAPSRTRLVEAAPAKVNLTLRILARRPDGYHSLESLVAFARLTDRLTLTPGRPLELSVGGPTANASGDLRDNLVLKAARALAREVPGLRLGRFTLTKRIPVAAGLGGGSSDAAAALRLLARANRIAPDDPRLMKAARRVGADVPVCLDPRPRTMRGIGERLSKPLSLPALPAVLVNPGIELQTRAVFARLGRARGGKAARSGLANIVPTDREALFAFLEDHGNDLEPPAIALAPPVARVLKTLRALPGCRLARMSGSGATCFGLFASSRAAAAGARALAQAHPRWWIKTCAIR
jgi:4-diphosphocytidyl-2-C-methyl-D-erythritol kinase